MQLLKSLIRSAEKNPPAPPGKLKKQAFQGSIETLKRLVPVGKLGGAKLRELSVYEVTYHAGEIIFNRGEIEDSLIYLVSGKVYIETTGKHNFLIEENTFDAFHPLSSGEFRNVTAICKTEAKVLFFPKVALDIFRQPFIVQSGIPQTLPTRYKDNLLLNKFVSTGQIDIPTLPDVALKLRQAVQKDIGLSEAATIINRDPSISANLIQIANSSLYRGINPVATTLDAINRIGLNNTKNLVTSISLRKLYKNNHSALNKLAQGYWRQSIKTSALSQSLSLLTKIGNPEEALLGGLISNIGVIPFLTFVGDQKKDDINMEDVFDALDYVGTAMSTLILEKWNFSEDMRKIPLQTQNWFMAGDSQTAGLSDIVLLAKYHSLLGSQHTKKLPPITSLPSYALLQNGELNADNSLQIMHDAKEQIQETMRFFGS